VNGKDKKKKNAPEPNVSIPGLMGEGSGDDTETLPGYGEVGGYGESGAVAGPNGYYTFPNSYWDSPSRGKKRSTSGPEYGDYENVPMYDPAGLEPIKSERQDVHSDGAYRMLNPQQQELVRLASNSRGGYAVPASWYEGTLDKALSISHYSGQGDGPIITVEEALRQMIDPDVLKKIGSGGSGGRGGRAAPQAPDATSIRKIMDATSNNLVGRTLSDAEFDKYYKNYVDQFNANPDLDTQQVLTERVRKEEDYQEMQVASKFSKAMSSIMKGAI
jgi:hypothetical protein